MGAACGYAHLVREFRAPAGVTPTSPAAEIVITDPGGNVWSVGTHRPTVIT